MKILRFLLFISRNVNFEYWKPTIFEKIKVMNEIIFNEKELDCAATEFIGKAGDKRHIAFYAQMGAGKTTFISALCRALGAYDEANSPTFSIINEYATANVPIYHFDFYRIETPEEAIDLGLDDYFDSGSYCFMEWPELVEDLLPDDLLRVTIDVLEDGRRIIKF